MWTEMKKLSNEKAGAMLRTPCPPPPKKKYQLNFKLYVKFMSNGAELEQPC
jgi:hypothetical protein